MVASRTCVWIVSTDAGQHLQGAHANAVAGVSSLSGDCAKKARSPVVVAEFSSIRRRLAQGFRCLEAARWVKIRRRVVNVAEGEIDICCVAFMTVMKEIHVGSEMGEVDELLFEVLQKEFGVEIDQTLRTTFEWTETRRNMNDVDV